MGIENIYVSTHLNVGPRYVFFKSLSSAQPQKFYNKILSIGNNYVSAAASILSPKLLKENQNKQDLDKIYQYINFIREVAENEQQNEYNFIKKIKDYINKDEILNNDINTFLNESNLTNSSEFNYLQLINLLNRIMRTNDELNAQRDEKILNTMRIIEKNFTEPTDAFPELLEEIQEQFETNYSAYRKSIASLIPDDIYEDNIISINEALATKINQTLNILSSSKPFENLIIQQVTTSGWNKDEIYKYIYAIVVEKISKMDYDSLIKFSAKDIAQDIINNFNSLLSEITEDMANNIDGMFNKKSAPIQKKLEVVAMTTKEGLADLFNSLSTADQQEFLNLDRKNSEELFNKMQSQNTAASKGQFTKALGAAIRKKFQDMNFKASNENNKEIEKQVLEFMQQNKKNFKQYDYENEFKSNLNVKTTGSSLAEYLTTHADLLKNAIVYGNSTKFKTDLSITLTFDDFNNITFLKRTDKNELLSKLKNFMPTMLDKYKQKNQEIGNALEQTDVRNAHLAFQETMKEIYDKLNQLKISNDKQNKKRQQLLDTISNFILTSISVKDYTFYSNQLGQHGGSLGGGSTPENVLNNILTMYELGGITRLDKDLLLFAILNSSSATIGSGLKEDLATYLLGGAAMIMFDDGFTAASSFLAQTKKEFGFTMASLHLYRLSGKFIPASYVYFSIYNNLLKVYTDLAQETSIKNVQNQGNKVVITNNITENSIPYGGSPQARWDAVSNDALSSISITFTFMAGLLDIFEALPNAFNNIK